MKNSTVLNSYVLGLVAFGIVYATRGVQSSKLGDWYMLWANYPSSVLRKRHLPHFQHRVWRTYRCPSWCTLQMFQQKYQMGQIVRSARRCRIPPIRESQSGMSQESRTYKWPNCFGHHCRGVHHLVIGSQSCTLHCCNRHRTYRCVRDNPHNCEPRKGARLSS